MGAEGRPRSGRGEAMDGEGQALLAWLSRILKTTLKDKKGEMSKGKGFGRFFSSWG